MPRPTLLLLRHATCSAPAGTCLGQRDVPLDEPGRRAARALAGRWALSLSQSQPLPQRVYCSDLLRARQTLAPLLGAPLLGAQPLDVCYDARLRELSFGAWEGRSWDALQREQEAALAHWGQHWLHAAPPDGESGLALFGRVANWHAEWLAAGAPPALVVAHAGSLRALACLLSGHGPERLFDTSPAHCAPWQAPAGPFDKAPGEN